MATTTTSTETNGQNQQTESTDTSNDGTSNDTIERVREFVVSPLGIASIVGLSFLVLILVQTFG